MSAPGTLERALPFGMCDALTDASLKKAEEELGSGKPYVDIRLIGCSWSDEEALRLFQSILDCPTVLGLTFRQMELSDYDFKLLCQVISSKSIQQLVFHDCSIQAPQCQQLVEAIKVKNTVQDLHLSENPISLKGLQHITSGMKEGCSIRALGIDDCGLTDDAVFELIPVIRSGALLSLNMAYNRLEQVETVRQLANCLRENKELQLLNLDSCNISPYGAKILGDALSADDAGESELGTLSLNHNLIGDAGAVYLGDVIARRPHLSNISLANCNLGDESAAIISSGIKVRENEVKIDLGANPITAQGEAYLAEGCGLAKLVKMAVIDDPETENLRLLIQSMGGLASRKVRIPKTAQIPED